MYTPPSQPAAPPQPPPRMPGAVRIGRVLGVDLFVHNSWLIVAVILLLLRENVYSSQLWNALEYVSLFGIVLLHEFGHALACRSVGGRADRILLWPLGGVAFVQPPPRAGAYLWSIVAGPLVNVGLIPVTLAVLIGARELFPDLSEDAKGFLFAIAFINIVLLVFNLLPIYPLDGGQIVRGLLWLIVGPIRSLGIAATIGLIGALGALVLAALAQDVWLVIMAVFAASRSWAGLQAARLHAAVRDAPQRPEFVCPACRTAAPAGAFWTCACGEQFDTFGRGWICPRCGRGFAETICPRCGQVSPVLQWCLPLRDER